MAAIAEHQRKVRSKAKEVGSMFGFAVPGARSSISFLSERVNGNSEMSPSRGEDGTAEQAAHGTGHIDYLIGMVTNEVDPEWGVSRKLAAIVILSTPFKLFMSLVILITIVFVVYDTNVRSTGDPTPSWLQFSNTVLLAIYILEIVLRIYVYRKRFFFKVEDGRCSSEQWNLFDLFVVITDMLSFTLEKLLGAGAVSSVAFLRILRMGRVLRLFRVFLRFPELKMLIHGIASAMKAICWATIMIILILLVWSIIAVELIHPLVREVNENGGFAGCSRCGRAFENVESATLTFLQTIIAGDSWGQYVVPVVEYAPWTIFIFLSVIATVQLGLMNLILAVIVDRAQQARLEDTELQLEEKDDRWRHEKEVLMKCCAEMDKRPGSMSGVGELDMADLMYGYGSIKELRNLLSLMNITKIDLEVVFEVCDVNSLGKLSHIDFVEQLFLMRTADANSLFIYTVRNIKRVIEAHKIELCNSLSFLPQKDNTSAVSSGTGFYSDGSCRLATGVISNDSRGKRASRTSATSEKKNSATSLNLISEKGVDFVDPMSARTSKASGTPHDTSKVNPAPLAAEDLSAPLAAEDLTALLLEPEKQIRHGVEELLAKINSQNERIEQLHQGILDMIPASASSNERRFSSRHPEASVFAALTGLIQLCTLHSETHEQLGLAAASINGHGALLEQVHDLATRAMRSNSEVVEPRQIQL